MSRYYFDHACTTFPKPPEVTEAMLHFMTNVGSNINRGDYRDAYTAAEVVYETRQLLAELMNASDSRYVVFTQNVTTSLNMILKGFLKEGDHVLVSSMEHHAVMRPLVQLGKKGVSFSRMPCRRDGTLELEQVESLITPQTRAIILNHASNVCGTIMPLHEIGQICRKHGLFFIVDCAQSAGILPIDMKADCIDALAFTGHKNLLGPQGIGGFILSKRMIPEIEPLIVGGTGSMSHSEEIPECMPDRFEAGTLNLPGIYGLNASLKWLKAKGIDAIYNHEKRLTDYFLQRLAELQSRGLLTIIGCHDATRQIGVISIKTLKKDLAQTVFELDCRYGIMTRVGLHCAPIAHQTLGTFPEGTLRFSLGYSTTIQDIDVVVEALEEILI